MEPLTRPARRLMAGITLAVALVFSLAAAFNPSVFESADYIFYDLFMKSNAQKAAPRASGPGSVTIVDIDETSLSAAGQWPWPRYRLARLVQLIHREGPRAMGIDILFPEPDRASLDSITRQFKTDFDLKIKFSGVPKGLSDNDGFFAHIMAQTGTVGARYFYFDHSSKGMVCKNTPFTVKDPDRLLDLHQATGVLCNTPRVETRLTATGFINNQYDGDGLLRKTPLLIQHQDTIYPHLSLALFMTAQGLDSATVKETATGPCICTGPFTIPVTVQGAAAMHFKGPGYSHDYVSAVDILNNHFDPTLIRDRVVLIGSSAMGLNDIHPTVFDPHYPGVEVSAVLMDNFLDNGLVILPDWNNTAAALLTLLTGLAMAAMFYTSAGPGILLALTLAWSGVLFFAAMILFMGFSVFISPAAPLVTALALFALISLFRFAQEKRAAFHWYQQLASAQQLTMEAMVSMVETRDPETGEHIVRTQYYARAIAEHLRDTGHFTDILTDHYINTLFLSAPLHDIGKVGVPDNILLKPGRLTDDEFVIMKMHADHGRNIIIRAAQKHKGHNYLDLGAEIAGSHHEKWNGQGYPNGLSQDQIPLAGRIMAISDVYDALISRRCYKPPFSHEKAMGIILEEKGKLFDPTVVEAFVEIEPEIRHIAETYSDSEEEHEET